MSSLSSVIYLISCHGGPADHFATYTEALTKNGYEVRNYATGPAFAKLQQRKIKGDQQKEDFSLTNLQQQEQEHLAEQIAKTCSSASLVITDVGHAFDIVLQKALAIHASKVVRLAYYDNPEPYVPGGYSSTAALVMQAAQGVLFANASLAHSTLYSEPNHEIDFGTKNRYGIGYYPVEQADKIAIRREREHDINRAAFLKKHGIEDKGQKIWVYFGGNNEAYFEKAFPAFLLLLYQVKLSNVLIVLQQHPGAKESNRDLKQVIGLPIIPSDLSSDEAQVIADAAFYYQTSMGPQFALEGIPTVQIGHETYEDILVRNKLAPSITNVEQFTQVIAILNSKDIPQPKKEDVLKNLGIRSDWSNYLEGAIKGDTIDGRTKDLKDLSDLKDNMDQGLNRQ